MTKYCRLRIFLCYTSQDKLISSELYQQLRGEGEIDPRLDKKELLSSLHAPAPQARVWDVEVKKAMKYIINIWQIKFNYYKFT